MTGVPIDTGWAWMVAFGSCIHNIVLIGIMKSFGIILVEIQKQFHTSSAVGSSIVSAQCISYGLAVPFALNVLTEVFSNRQIMLCGSLIASVGISCIFFARNIGTLIFLYGALHGIGNASLFGPGLVMVGRYFDKRRGLVTAIAVAGGSIGQLVVPPIVRILQDTYGFNGGMLLLGGLYLQSTMTSCLMRPLSYYENDKQKSSSTRKSNRDLADVLASTLSVTSKSNDIDKTTKKSLLAKFFDKSLLKNAKFIFLLLASCFGTVGSVYIGIYLAPHAKEHGISDQKIVWLVTIIGGFELVGRISCGILADSKKVQRIFLLMFSFTVNGALGLAAPWLRQYWHFCLFCVISGLFGGVFFSLISLIVADFFGIDALAKTLGVLLLFEALSNGITPLILGILRDTTSTYDASFYYLGGVSFMAAIFLVPCKYLSSRQREKEMNINVNKPTVNENLLNGHEQESKI